jgi:transposase-like protein
MRELSVAEQRYQAVLSVIKDGRTVTETAAAVGVSRQTLHAWLAKYEAGGLEGLVDGSHRPLTSPQQMPATVEAARGGSTRHGVRGGSRSRSASPVRAWW